MVGKLSGILELPQLNLEQLQMVSYVHPSAHSLKACPLCGCSRGKVARRNIKVLFQVSASIPLVIESPTVRSRVAVGRHGKVTFPQVWVEGGVKNGSLV